MKSMLLAHGTVIRIFPFRNWIESDMRFEIQSVH